MHACRGRAASGSERSERPQRSVRCDQHDCARPSGMPSTARMPRWPRCGACRLATLPCRSLTVGVHSYTPRQGLGRITSVAEPARPCTRRHSPAATSRACKADSAWPALPEQCMDRPGSVSSAQHASRPAQSSPELFRGLHRQRHTPFRPPQTSPCELQRSADAPRSVSMVPPSHVVTPNITATSAGTNHAVLRGVRCT